jgi:transposase
MSAPLNWSWPSSATVALKAPCTLPNTPAGHRQLLKLLTHRGAGARVCLEATGVYNLRLALALERAARVEVMVVNPRAIKDFQRARLTRAQTGQGDALGSLEFLARMEFSNDPKLRDRGARRSACGKAAGAKVAGAWAVGPVGYL